MPSFQDQLRAYREQLAKGSIQAAYRGLMGYLMDLRSYFQNQYADFFVSGSLYTGYMDMSYFSIVPKTFKERRLKAAVVFLHEPFRFEGWLAGTNKQVQARTWALIRDSGWDRYPLTPSLKGSDSILETVLVSEPDFNDLEALTRQIEREVMGFITDIEGFLRKHAPAD
jgi:hypothetical protein